MHTIVLFGEILADVFHDYTVLGGAPYNVARHLKGLQQQPILISRAGHDALKDKLFAEMSKLGIAHVGIQLDAVYPTGQVTVHMENNRHRFDINPDQAYDYIDADETSLITIKAQPTLAYFGTLAQRSMTSRLALDAFLQHAHCPLFLDINLRSPWYNKQIIHHSLSHATIVKINDEELKIVCELFNSQLSNNQDRALFLSKTFDLKHLFVTCGEGGAWALSSNGKITSAEGKALSSTRIDTVGAGDAFSAVCIIGLLNNWSIETMLSRANIFAAALCQIKGAAPESQEFYLPYINNWG